MCKRGKRAGLSVEATVTNGNYHMFNLHSFRNSILVESTHQQFPSGQRCFGFTYCDVHYYLISQKGEAVYVL
jgi:hypothetical protein